MNDEFQNGTEDSQSGGESLGRYTAKTLAGCLRDCL